ncbi:MAG: hypothetical protein JWP57_1522, partial [Spirosoma sp.]|nr:hypothetical protein [Spirosoma sp.]
MEPDTLISGNDEHYLIANFYPSITSEEEKLKNWDRYKRGKIFLANHKTDTNANVCYALTDTMHECRERIGGGTMYSFIADLDKGAITLCFYHDFQHPITFRLQQELAKGDHDMIMASIFPPNAEYQTFINIQTPRNNTHLLLLVFLSGGLFAFSSLFFFVSFIGDRRKSIYEDPGKRAKLLLTVISILLLYYMTILYRDEGIYFASVPFKGFQFSLHDISAYTPFLLLLLILPLIQMNLLVIQRSSWGFFSKNLLPLIIFFIWPLSLCSFTGGFIVSIS